MHRTALIAPVPVGLPAWRGKIIVTEAGLAHPGAAARNAEIALTEDPAFAGAIRWDALRAQVMICAPLPWASHWQTPRPWEETDDTRAMLWLQDQGIAVRSSRAVGEIIDVIAEANAYHPTIDYFRALGWPNSSIWDSEPRVGGDDNPSWLSRYCGVEDSRYTRAIGSGWALITIARLFDPGCQAPVLVLGGVGVDKSVVFKILGGAFYDQVSALGVKDAALERRRSAWIIEMTDLDQLRRLVQWRGVIDFAARDGDELLDRSRRRRQRPCVFCASSELEDGLPVRAEAHEWYLVRCGMIDAEALIRDRAQFWAEALVRYGTRAAREIPETNGKLPRIGAGRMQDGVGVLRQFLSERCEAGRAAMIAKDTLLADYNAWRSTCGLAPLNKHWLGRHLKRAASEVHDYRPEKRPFEDRRQHYYRGLRVISERRG